MAICNLCGIDKPLDGFYKSGPNAYRKCKVCMKASRDAKMVYKVLGFKRLSEEKQKKILDLYKDRTNKVKAIATECEVNYSTLLHWIHTNQIV